MTIAFWLLLVQFTFSSIAPLGRVVDGVSTSNSPGGNWCAEVEFCGPNKFLCRSSQTCLPRDRRCDSHFTNCSNQFDCYARNDSKNNQTQFEYWSALTHLPQSQGSSRRRRLHRRHGNANDTEIGLSRPISHNEWRFSHSFVQYRGFVYEFGRCYGTQELDVNDPNYKYRRPNIENWDWTPHGYSSCSRQQILSFLDQWKALRLRYNYMLNNCHYFSKALLNVLRCNCAFSWDSYHNSVTCQ